MDETLGKRIVANRKRLGITQDRLAEQLGVTAQAVSKWENDQSCPDITMLPKLAAIFGSSVDELLGVVQPKQEYVHKAEIVTEEEPEKSEKAGLDLSLEPGKKVKILFALWVICTGGLMLFAQLTNRDHVSLWNMAWPSALLFFGLSGLHPKFSFFRLGCALFGSYSLLEALQLTSLGLSSKLFLIIAVLLFGLSLLVDALRTPRDVQFSVTRGKENAKRKVFTCKVENESFVYDCAFCDEHQIIQMPLLSHGTADISFGEFTLDLTKCTSFSKGCTIDADCSFGKMNILVPKWCRANVKASTAFGSVDTYGNHDSDFRADIYINADVDFGQITVHYI